MDASARERRYRANAQAEVDRAAVYAAMAEAERDALLAESSRRLAGAEARHAEFWRRRLGESADDPPPRPSARARILVMLARRFGSRLVLPAAASMEEIEQRDRRYQPEADGTEIATSEREHARVFDRAVEASTPKMLARILDRLLGRRYGVTGNALRAAVRAQMTGWSRTELPPSRPLDYR